jgi:hypothetical protein
LTYADVCWHMLTYAETKEEEIWGRERVPTRMLTYAHVCSRMLTYAHVCSRMLRPMKSRHLTRMLTYAETNEESALDRERVC